MNGFKLTKKIGEVELWKHPAGHKFIRFSDSSLSGKEIPHPKKIPQIDYPGVNFVTTLETEVSGKKQQIWAKEVGGKADDILKIFFTNPKNRYRKNTHHARTLRQIRAAGFQAPEPLGILYPASGKPLMLTTHINGSPCEDRIERRLLVAQLKLAGLHPSDFHKKNIFKTEKGLAIIDASRFGPVNKEKLLATIKRQKQIQQQKLAKKRKLL